ncbi:MAG TPA: hypothetical protein VFH54_14900 [Mycobacteriales bacterium]|nr:hypothetical protein [Mycobacteriales bacterium]
MLDAEVFPVESGRWIAVIKNPAGEFSTEAASPDEVPGAVWAAIAEVLGEPVAEHRLVDERGQPWDLAVAEEQARLLDR